MFSWGETGGKTINGLNVTVMENGVNFLRLGSGPITDVSAGLHMAASIRRDGNVFVLRVLENQDGSRVPGKMKHVKFKEKMRSVKCGDGFLVVLSNEGRVYCLNTEPIPRCVESLRNIKVSQVACGNKHSLALTKDGQVYVWGEDASGQLGLGETSLIVRPPQHLTSLSTNPLVQITAGGDQSFALSVSGAVFSWGDNSSGQLGLGDTTDRHTPTLVECLNMKKTIYVSCGEKHTAILTKGGTVFMFGSGQHGQLGHNSFRDEVRPRIVAELWGSKVISIACGSHHTLVLTQSRRVYSFGCGHQGQLGQGEADNQSIPQPVELLQDFASQEIGHIYAGGNCSYAMLEFQQMTNNPTGHRTQHALDNMINTWTHGSNSKPWKTIQQEIKRTFSSASCLNRSFLDRRNDKHFQTSQRCSGLNLSQVHQSLEKLMTMDKVLEKVEAVVTETLLPSLDVRLLGVEGLRVYLLLTELLCVFYKHKGYQSIGIVTEVAAAILRLPPDSLEVLGTWWCSLNPSTITKHVEVWKQALSMILCSGVLLTVLPPAIKDLLQVLQLLYTANDKMTGPDRIAESIFTLDINFNALGVIPNILCDFPFIMNLQSKITYFQIRANCTMKLNQPHTAAVWPFTMPQPTSSDYFFELRLKRASLVDDTFEQLRGTNHITFKKPIVVYLDEASEISKVYQKDFFLRLFDELLLPESGMFMYNETKTLAWFPSNATLQKEKYFLFGVLCGLALYNNNVIRLPFPVALFKKLVDVEPKLEDLKEFSPGVETSLQYILDYEDDDIEDMYMFFTVDWDQRTVELDPSNPGRPVTSQNKQEFVDAYVDFAFNKSVQTVFAEFRQGFFKVCDKDMVKLFRPDELRGAMAGKEHYDWGKLKQNTVYQAQYHASHPNIVWFWEVFDELTDKQKIDFLVFLTGHKQVPILGMDQVRMTVRVLFNSTLQHFPTSLTCHSILDLPLYTTKDMLRARLSEALSHNRGFFN